MNLWLILRKNIISNSNANMNREKKTTTITVSNYGNENVSKEKNTSYRWIYCQSTNGSYKFDFYFQNIVA